MASILVVDDEASIRAALERFLKQQQYEVIVVKNGREAIDLCSKRSVDLAIVDLVMPKMGGVELIQRLKKTSPDTVVIVLTGFGTIESAVEAVKAGASHYLTKPFELDDLSALIDRALEHRRLQEENRQLKGELQGRYHFQNIIGTSEKIQRVFEMIEKVADTSSTVLLLGESGTGKELLARALHYRSSRRDQSLVTVNCAAIPEDLLESELFGHVRGAFTGAHQTRQGRFNAAHRGTIFLDEIGDMSPKLQVKLLRVLQEQKFESVGSNQTHEVDVRVIAATNQNLEEAVKQRKFREDLFYRLNVIPVHVPPLRERVDDIPLLVHHFIEKYSPSNGDRVKGIQEAALREMKKYPWPGNVRELENTIERAIVLCRSDSLGLEHIAERISVEIPKKSQTNELPDRYLIELPESGISFKGAVADFESNLIIQALERTGWNKNQAAHLLKLNRTTLVEKMKKRQLSKGHGSREKST